MKGVKLGLFGISLGIAGLSFGTNHIVAICLALLGSLLALAACFIKEN